MSFFNMEHSRAAYRADFALYGVAVLALAGSLAWSNPPGVLLQLLIISLAGLIGWTLIEYFLHRFVLHGVQPFQRWHEAHHERPRALICAPTVLSATLIAVFIFLPALLVGGAWRACALTLGLLIGYLAYAVTHHAIHHWRSQAHWLNKRKRWHALHHHLMHPRCYGVTSGFWDEVFGTACVSATSASSPSSKRKR
jgi:sterol desaturase/sphingolipid hydroxylase (fatty acid hydroxylase superfamily)